jgi:hypothetical protein
MLRAFVHILSFYWLFYIYMFPAFRFNFKLTYFYIIYIFKPDFYNYKPKNY